MSDQSRQRIFARLTAGSQRASKPIVKPNPIPAKTYNQAEKIETLKTLMEAMRTEVHVTDAQNWIHQLASILEQRKLKNLVYPPQTALGDALEDHWENDRDNLPQWFPMKQK